MPGRLELTKKDIQQIQALLKLGYSMREVARAVGCSDDTLRNHGFSSCSPPRRFTEKEKSRIIAMRKRGCTIGEIAIALDCSRNAVGHHVRKLGPIPSLKARRFKPRRRISEEIKRRVVELRRQGHTFEKIANMLDMAYPTARYIVLDSENSRKAQGASSRSGRKEK